MLPHAPVNGAMVKAARLDHASQSGNSVNF